MLVFWFDQPVLDQTHLPRGLVSLCVGRLVARGGRRFQLRPRSTDQFGYEEAQRFMPVWAPGLPPFRFGGSDVCQASGGLTTLQEP